MIDRKYLAGFAFGMSFIALLGLTQIQNKYDNERNIFNEFLNVYQQSQPKSFRVVITSVTLNDIEEQELVIENVGSKRLVTRINNTIFDLEFTQR